MSRMEGLDRMLAKRLDEIRARGLFRKMVPFSSRDGPFAHYDGRKVIDMSTNDYLGLSTDEDVREAFIDTAKSHGIGATGSRLICGDCDIHEELEDEIADLKKKKAAIVYPTGFQANIGLFSALGPELTSVFSDELNHASIVHGIRLSRAEKIVYPHLDMDALSNELATKGGQGAIITTDGVFSMEGDIAPLPTIIELAEDHGSWVMVDDAHATGVLGKNGGGTAEHFGITEKVDIQMGTLSKAIGCLGGFIAGSDELIDFLRNTSKSFIYSTGLPPPIAAASLTAIRKMRSDGALRKRLWDNLDLLGSLLKENGFDIGDPRTPIVPLMVGEETKAMAFADRLLKKGVFVRAVRWPSVPRGTARIRMIVTAALGPDQIRTVVEALTKVGREVNHPRMNSWA